DSRGKPQRRCSARSGETIHSPWRFWSTLPAVVADDSGRAKQEENAKRGGVLAIGALFWKAVFMGPGIRAGGCAVCWAFTGLSAAAHSESPPVGQVEPLQPPRPRPGESPDPLFREPHPAPVIETSQDFHEKYLFGDWLGARREL